jgi:DSP-PTPase phosphatase fused to NAD+ Kinase
MLNSGLFRRHQSASRAKRFAQGLAACAALATMLLFLAAPAFAQDSCPFDFPHDANPTAIRDADVCNFHQVDAQLYRGGRPQPSAFPKLAALGVHAILDLEESSSAARERESLEQYNRLAKPQDRIALISFPITQSEIYWSGLSDDQVRRLFSLIEQAPKPLYIHCFYGKDRTGAVVALYRMATGEKSYQEAYQEALHYRYSQLDLGLSTVLRRYKNDKKINSLLAPPKSKQGAESPAAEPSRQVQHAGSDPQK